VDAEHLGQHDRGEPREDLGVAVAAFGGLQHVAEAGLHPRLGRTGRAHDEDRREGGQGRVEERILDVEVAADDIRSLTSGAVSHDRQLRPWRRRHEVEHRDTPGMSAAAHLVLVPVRQHDHVALIGPVPLAVVDRHPATARRDDVKEQQALPPGPEQAGHHLAGRRLVGPLLGVLATQEDGALEPQPVERRPHGCVAHRCCGFSISRRGVPVMASAVLKSHILTQDELSVSWNLGGTSCRST
jgi:hypothetical protein